MTPVIDVSVFDWIGNGRDAQAHRADSPGWKGNFVAHCIPRVFVAYCKILHPIYEDPAIHDHAMTWENVRRTTQTAPESESGREALAEILADATFVRRSAGIESTPGPRVLWRNLAESNGLIFHPAFNAESFRRAFNTGSWPRYLLGPTEGTLDKSTCEALLEVLEPFSQKQTVYFRFSDYLLNDSPHLYAGRLDEASLFLARPKFGGTPEYWWPEDRSWCVCTDWDLTFTLVGGSRSIVDACLAHPFLECLEVKPETRIDYLADSLNVPKHPDGRKFGFSQ